MTETEQLLEAIAGVSMQIELTNAIIAGLFLVLGIICGIVLLYDLFRGL